VTNLQSRLAGSRGRGEEAGAPITDAEAAAGKRPRRTRRPARPSRAVSRFGAARSGPADLPPGEILRPENLDGHAEIEAQACNGIRAQLGLGNFRLSGLNRVEQG
jgi:hypothetical protein